MDTPADLVDTHRRRDAGGFEIGTLTVFFKRDGKLLAIFICEDLVPSLHAKAMFDIIACKVDWDVLCEEAMKNDATWSNVLAMKPLPKAPMPGGFAIETFLNEPVLQLCAVGMNMYAIQVCLLQSLPRFRDLANDMDEVVTWLLAAYADAPRSKAAVRAHGDIAYCTGSTAFLKQLGP